MREERTLFSKGRHLSQDVQAKIATLELSLPDVAPLRKGDRMAIAGVHRQGVTMYDVLRQHIGGSSIQVLRLLQTQVLGENPQHIRAAFGDVVRQELNPVSAHHSEKGVVPLLEVGFPELEFN